MTIAMSPYDYYVYVLESSVPTELTRFNDRKYGYVFYVGKGVGIRIHVHEEEARLGHDCRKCNFIRALWDRGARVKKKIVFATPDQEVAYLTEHDLINKIGRENLVNVQVGQKSWKSQEQKLIEHHQRMVDKCS